MWDEFFGHSGNVVSVLFHEPQMSLQRLFQFGETQFNWEILNLVSLW